jgi:L-alanine-DL-glutamate epimerase-like enolase superfamily enzyme
LPTRFGIEDGMMGLPDRPGIGFEGQRALFEIMRGVGGVQ